MTSKQEFLGIKNVNSLFVKHFPSMKTNLSLCVKLLNHDLTNGDMRQTNK